MKNRRLISAIFFTISLAAACSTGEDAVSNADFAVLAQSAEGFSQAGPGKTLTFPLDHGSHPNFRIEWWYLTANLLDASGNPHGAQWTLFRMAVDRPGEHVTDNAWQSGQVFMAHFAITTPDAHAAFQRYSRGGDHEGEARAGVTADPFAAWLDDWILRSTGAGWLPMEAYARQGRHGIELRLDGNVPLVLQGAAGYSQKHPDGGGSFYYSQPFLEAKGGLIVDGKVIPVSGQAWLDREWSSQFLQGKQSGWDWFALHLESGEKLMLFQLRQRDGESSYRHGVLIRPDGSKQTLDPDRIGLRPVNTTQVAGRDLPLQWQLDLPEIGRSMQVEALHPDQWMDVDFPYWEGAVEVDGDSPSSRGVGYLELTGYIVNDTVR